jgi:hypothetical protein
MTTSRSLLPREHGAYAELAFPLVTGLALAPPTVSALALAAAAWAFFLAHEPLAILLGLRGARLQVEEAVRSRHRAGLLLGIGTLSGSLGVFGAGRLVWPSLLFPVVPLLALLPLFLMGRQKSLSGELLVITVFATSVFPLGAASSASAERMTAAAAVWWVSFVLGTLEVHAIKARHKNTARSRWTRWGSPGASGVTVLFCGGMALFGEAPYLWPAVAVAAPSIAVLSLSALRVHPRHLKKVGWTLVGANTAALITLLAFG